MDNEPVMTSIITIGDELMIGQVIDTNSAWIGRQLNEQGFWVRKRVAVGDNAAEIREALDEERRHSKIILITGGLGPTADDITKPLLCEYFGSRLIVNQDVLEHVRHLFEDVFKRPFTDINRKQAEVPEACTVIHNARGTAPGMLFEKDGAVFISMPGVPYEMQGMMTTTVIPLLKEKFTPAAILHRTLLTVGIGESALAEHIRNWEMALPPYLKLAYLPGHGMVRLRITGTGSNREALAREIDGRFSVLKKNVATWMVTDEDLTMAQVVSRVLREKNKTLCTAESCTGGYIAHLITSIPGSSSIFRGSVVSYANGVKTDVLQVNPQTIESFGAVSEETVKEMVKGGIAALKADYCIATSGIMGPDGGSEAKPVGTVWVAVGDRDSVVTHRFQFRFDRMRNIETTAMQALNLLRKKMGE